MYRHVEGMTFQELKSRGDVQDMAEAAYAIGAALARLQTFSLAWPAGPALCLEITDECLCSPVLEQRLGGAERDRLRDFVSVWLPQIRQLHQEKELVHGDFSNRNTIVKREGRRWVVTGILDWEHAFSGSPLWDAARFICFERWARPCREPHFSRGFCENGGSLPKNWSMFSRALNAFTTIESLSRPDLPERFIPDLRELIVATLDGRDLS
ncbi:MAG TPA: phosphotransferase [Bryobacteraceae bacterium]|nr:phosphotransferase [Bryobacteraceae bacterium]